MKVANLLAGEAQLLPSIQTDILAITADSRQVRPGSLFFALKGAMSDGAIYIDEAIRAGAVAIVSDHLLKSDLCPVIEVFDARHALAVAAARFFNRQPEVIAAITGTSGKTSVASYLRQIWSYTGFAAASIGTIGVISPKETRYGSLTTPDPVTLHQILKKLSDDGVTHTAIEASSHGIDQKRLDGVELSAAAFTNLGRDHLDYHKTIDDYFAAKMRLFDTLLPRDLPAVVFADDGYSKAASDHIRANGRHLLTVGRKGTFIRLLGIEAEAKKQILTIRCDKTDYQIALPLIGEFQAFNVLVALGVAIVTGVPEDAAVKAVERLQGPLGRLQLVGVKNGRSPIFVDYAHKPEALANVLGAVRPLTNGRLILVFGCGGDRDKGKRPLMGAIAQKLADIVIVTDDNPRSESPAAIRQQIIAAAANALEIGSRHEAIIKAVNMLEDGDTLIVAGKGHETGQIVGDMIYPFSDQKEIVAALEALEA